MGNSAYLQQNPSTTASSFLPQLNEWYKKLYTILHAKSRYYVEGISSDLEQKEREEVLLKFRQKTQK
jgi:hypothetical protein